ncbi:MAG: hypothetical protein WD749_08615 [Phycisphaerales bacterium]
MSAAAVLHPRAHRLRWIAGWLLVSLALGLATTVAVAWALAAWLPHRGLARSFHLIGAVRNGVEDFTIEPIELDEYRRTGMTRRSWFTLRWGTFYSLGPLSMDYGNDAVSLKRAPDVSWGNLSASIERGPHAPTGGMEDARGWPWLALWCELRHGRDRTVSVNGGVPLSAATTAPGDYRALPCLPIWRGLLANTAVYAPAWMAALILFRWRPLRATLRRARNQCAACGYNRAGLAPSATCPECGKPFES